MALSSLISSEKPKKEAPNSSSSSIIGKSIRIGSLEVAQNDFPKTMIWNDAVKACCDLGNGWKLPTKYELNLMYLNKDKIGGFAYNAYWSSTEYDIGIAWGQYFNYGSQGLYSKTNGGYYVRAVRAF